MNERDDLPLHDSRVYRVNAAAAAQAWLNAFVATGRDKERPVLFRTLSVELFKAGVQFVSCDGTMLFRSWVPFSDIGDLPFGHPPADARPTEDAVVVSDIDKFAHGFMRTLLSAADEIAELELSIQCAENGDEPALGDELATYVLVLHALGQQLSCKLYEGAYPDWRALNFGIDEAERIDGITIAPRLFAAVGKLRGISGVDCTFRGKDRAIEFLGKGPADVCGLLMPMRRDDKQEATQEPEVTP